MGAYRGLAFIVGSEVGYTEFNDSYAWLGSEYLFGGIVPASLLLFLVMAAVVWFLIHRTIYGRRCFSFGLNPDAAWVAGVDVVRQKVIAYAIAGAFAGLAALGG